MALVDLLRACRSDLVGEGPELEAILLETYDRAKRSDVPLEPEVFVAYLAERLVAGDVAAGIAALNTTDLYLACACASGMPRAIEAFERELAGEVERVVRRVGPRGVEVDDVKQLLREKLFVAHGDAKPKIVEYTGHGPLRVWVRVTLLRIVQNLGTRGPRETLLDGEKLAEAAGASGDPELERMRQMYRLEFKRAFAAAVLVLPMNDRVLLHQRFFGRLSQEQLAETYGVHVNTIARWLVRARSGIEREVRAELARSLKLDDGEFTSILRLVADQLDLTIGKLVEPAP